MAGLDRRGLALGGSMVLLLWLVAPEARGQISPGELSRAHAALEGSARCLDCHRSGRGVDPDLCLSCHAVLGERIAAGEGLHVRSDYGACERCHIEHHGREFELVWWGDDGRDTFDHRLTGHRLAGAHRDLGCRSCHRADRVADAARLRRAGKDLDRTFLGLPTSCAGCHADPHRDQFDPAGCTSCHVEVSWSPAVRFDHAATGFRLTGGHEAVPCTRCHRAVEEAGATVVRWAGTATACAACHRDPHAGRFGGDCAACHSLAGWGRVDPSSFDHDRTRYPLRGRHRAVACTSCHREGGGGPRRIAGFERCETCHSDPHAGQVTGQVTGARACADCHGVGGWSPSTFSLADHQRTGYPLAGAHLAVPCVSCHAQVAVEALPEPARQRAMEVAAPGARVLRFAFEAPQSLACTDCHRDPHDGPYDGASAPIPDASGEGDPCLGCHSIESWRAVAFDHGRTGFVLAGGHARAACTACHAADGAGTESVRIAFSGRTPECAACHADPHAGQFDRGGQPADCARCHGAESWEPVGFDHDRDTRYPLVGAHRAVACAGCHPTELRAGIDAGIEGEVAVVRFRPLGMACSDCHAAGGSRE